MNTKDYILETEEETKKFNRYNQIEANRLDELFAKLTILEYQLTDRKTYAPYDASFSLHDKEYIAEAKVRNYKIADLESHYLLEDKASSLKQHWNLGKRILYIQFFNDGAIIYNLSKRFRLLERNEKGHQLIVRSENIVNNTAKDRGKSDKLVYDLFYKEELGDKKYLYKPNPIFFLNHKLY